MILPRLYKYELKRIKSTVHIILVDGDQNKIMCIRHLAKNGNRVDPLTEVTCNSCMHRGWIYTMGVLGNTPGPKDESGRFLSRT